MLKNKSIIKFMFYVLLSGHNAYALLPIKGVSSLGNYHNLHQNLARRAIAVTCDNLKVKYEVIKNINNSLEQRISKFKESMIFFEQFQTSDIRACVSETLIKSGKRSLDKKFELLASEIHTTADRLKTMTLNELGTLLLEYRNQLIQEICANINQGKYFKLFSSLPPSLLIDVHIPNIFVCAITFIQYNNNQKLSQTVYITEDSNELKIADDWNNCATFKSGEEEITNKDNISFCKYAIPVQVGALSGIIDNTNPLNSILSDIYRHSEQKCFQKLFSIDFIQLLISSINNAEIAVSEIIFHGHTLRDMCPNCRATLIGHEMLSIQQNIFNKVSVKQDSFLCAIQNEFYGKFCIMPKITCVISSCMEYGQRSDDICWNVSPQINLLKFNETADTDICSQFVNQFAFSEQEFLTMLSNRLMESWGTEDRDNFLINVFQERLQLLPAKVI